MEVVRNHNLKNPSLEIEKSVSRAEDCAFPEDEYEGEDAYHGISESLDEKRLNADTMTWLDSMTGKPWEYWDYFCPKTMFYYRLCHLKV